MVLRRSHDLETCNVKITKKTYIITTLQYCDLQCHHTITSAERLRNVTCLLGWHCSMANVNHLRETMKKH